MIYIALSLLFVGVLVGSIALLRLLTRPLPVEQNMRIEERAKAIGVTVCIIVLVGSAYFFPQFLGGILGIALPIGFLLRFLGGPL